MLKIGDQAPLFEADSTEGPIRLQDWIGKQPIVPLAGEVVRVRLAVAARLGRAA